MGEGEVTFAVRGHPKFSRWGSVASGTLAPGGVLDQQEIDPRGAKRLVALIGQAWDTTAAPAAGYLEKGAGVNIFIGDESITQNTYQKVFALFGPTGRIDFEGDGIELGENQRVIVFFKNLFTANITLAIEVTALFSRD